MTTNNNICKANLGKNKDNFRISSKRIFLTYSRCDLDIKFLIEELSKRKPLKDFLIAREFRSDSDKEENTVQTRFHVFLEFTSRLDTKNPRCFDVMGFRPKIEKVKNTQALLDYIVKDCDNSEDSSKILFSKGIGARLDKNANFVDPWDQMLALTKDGKVQEAYDAFKSSQKSEFVITRGKKVYQSLIWTCEETIEEKASYPLIRFDIRALGEEVISPINEAINEGQSIFIMADSGSFKSSFVKAFLERFKFRFLTINNWDSIRNFKIGVRNCILMDDLSLTDEQRWDKDLLTKMVDSVESTTFSIKRSSVTIPESTLRVIISTNRFDEVFDLLGKTERIRKPLKRRVTEFDLEPFLEDGRLPINPESTTSKKTKKLRDLPTEIFSPEDLTTFHLENGKTPEPGKTLEPTVEKKKKRGRPVGSKNKIKKSP